MYHHHSHIHLIAKSPESMQSTLVYKTKPIFIFDTEWLKMIVAFYQHNKKCLLLVNLIHGWQPILTTLAVFVYLGLIPFLLILYLCSSLLLLSFLSLASASWTVPIALPHSSKINHFLLGPTPFRWFHVTQRNPMGRTLHYPVTRSLQNVRIHLLSNDDYFLICEKVPLQCASFFKDNRSYKLSTPMTRENWAKCKSSSQGH